MGCRTTCRRARRLLPEERGDSKPRGTCPTPDFEFSAIHALPPLRNYVRDRWMECPRLAAGRRRGPSGRSRTELCALVGEHAALDGRRGG